MFGFITGTIFGALVGIVLDRVWQHFENRPRIHLRVGSYGNPGGKWGTFYRVRNVGQSPLPEYDLLIYHPQRGTYNGYTTSDSGPLLPDQTREHRLDMLVAGNPSLYIQHWLQHELDKFIEDPSPAGFVLKIRMKNSEKDLYTSQVNGEALATELIRTVLHQQPGKSKWGEHKRMGNRLPHTPRFWLERYRERQYLRGMMARKDDSQPPLQ